jgi:hypothetical protein
MDGIFIWFSPVSGLRFPVDSHIKSRHTAIGTETSSLEKQF